MNNLKKLLTISFLFLNLSTFGQNNTQSNFESPYIEVTGTAIREIIPDEIYIGITIHEKYENKVKVTIEEQEEKLKSAIKSIGVDLANLYLSDANVDLIKIGWKNKDLITNITVRNNSKIG